MRLDANRPHPSDATLREAGGNGRSSVKPIFSDIDGVDFAAPIGAVVCDGTPEKTLGIRYGSRLSRGGGENVHFAIVL